MPARKPPRGCSLMDFSSDTTSRRKPTIDRWRHARQQFGRRPDGRDAVRPFVQPVSHSLQDGVVHPVLHEREHDVLFRC